MISKWNGETSLRSERGFTLIDLLMAAGVLSVISASVVLTSITLSKSAGIIVRKSIASELAFSKLEELSALSPEVLDDSYDSLELGLLVEGHEFTRQVDVTVNSDNSRQVLIEVHPGNSIHTESVSITHTFALWGTT